MNIRNPKSNTRGGERRGQTRAAASPIEMWAENGIRYLTSADPDWASLEEPVKRGFDKEDTALGHWFDERFKAQKGLSNFEWEVAVKICERHQTQLAKAKIVRP